MTIMPVLEEMGLKSFVSHQILKVNANSVQAKDLLSGGENTTEEYLQNISIPLAPSPC